MKSIQVSKCKVFSLSSTSTTKASKMRMGLLFGLLLSVVQSSPQMSKRESGRGKRKPLWLVFTTEKLRAGATGGPSLQYMNVGKLFSWREIMSEKIQLTHLRKQERTPWNTWTISLSPEPLPDLAQAGPFEIHNWIFLTLNSSTYFDQ